jgi:hypothetical protein
MKSWKLVSLMAALVLAVALTGCSQLTRKNYDKVQTGMTLPQVEKILGKKDTVGPAANVAGIPDATETATWQEMQGKKKEKTVTVTVGLKDGRVVGKTASGL